MFPFIFHFKIKVFRTKNKTTPSKPLHKVERMSRQHIYQEKLPQGTE